MLQRAITENKDLQLLQDNVERALTLMIQSVGKNIQSVDSSLQGNIGSLQSLVTALQSSAFSKGTVLKNVSLVSSTYNNVAHGLGVTPTVWALLDQDTQSTVWCTGKDATNLVLQCTADCTVSLWVANA